MPLMHMNEIYNNCRLSSLNNYQRHNRQIQVLHVWEAAATKPGPCREKHTKKKYNGTMGNFQEVLRKFPLFIIKFPFFYFKGRWKKESIVACHNCWGKSSKNEDIKEITNKTKAHIFRNRYDLNPATPESHNKDSKSSYVRLKWSHLVRANLHLLKTWIQRQQNSIA